MEVETEETPSHDGKNFVVEDGIVTAVPSTSTQPYIMKEDIKEGEQNENIESNDIEDGGVEEKVSSGNTESENPESSEETTSEEQEEDNGVERNDILEEQGTVSNENDESQVEFQAIESSDAVDPTPVVILKEELEDRNEEDNKLVEENMEPNCEVSEPQREEKISDEKEIVKSSEYVTEVDEVCEEEDEKEVNEEEEKEVNEEEEKKVNEEVLTSFEPTITEQEKEEEKKLPEVTLEDSNDPPDDSIEEEEEEENETTFDRNIVENTQKPPPPPQQKQEEEEEETLSNLKIVPPSRPFTPPRRSGSVEGSDEGGKKIDSVSPKKPSSPDIEFTFPLPRIDINNEESVEDRKENVTEKKEEDKMNNKKKTWKKKKTKKKKNGLDEESSCLSPWDHPIPSPPDSALAKSKNKIVKRKKSSCAKRKKKKIKKKNKIKRSKKSPTRRRMEVKESQLGKLQRELEKFQKKETQMAQKARDSYYTLIEAIDNKKKELFHLESRRKLAAKNIRNALPALPRPTSLKKVSGLPRRKRNVDNHSHRGGGILSSSCDGGGFSCLSSKSTGSGSRSKQRQQIKYDPYTFIKKPPLFQLMELRYQREILEPQLIERRRKLEEHRSQYSPKKDFSVALRNFGEAYEKVRAEQKKKTWESNRLRMWNIRMDHLYSGEARKRVLDDLQRKREETDVRMRVLKEKMDKREQYSKTHVPRPKIDVRKREEVQNRCICHKDYLNQLLLKKKSKVRVRIRPNGGEQQPQENNSRKLRQSISPIIMKKKKKNGDQQEEIINRKEMMVMMKVKRKRKLANRRVVAKSPTTRNTAENQEEREARERAYSKKLRKLGNDYMKSVRKFSNLETGKYGIFDNDHHHQHHQQEQQRLQEQQLYENSRYPEKNYKYFNSREELERKVHELNKFGLRKESIMKKEIGDVRDIPLHENASKYMLESVKAKMELLKKIQEE